MNFPKLYECDPQKNTECNKRNCGNPCMHTTRKEFAREPSERMSIERAFEILDPTHRERYESLEPVNEACRMGRAALFLQMKESPYPDGDEGVLACPNCGSGEYLHNEDGTTDAVEPDISVSTMRTETETAFAVNAVRLSHGTRRRTNE